jgi:hypothetical protein
MKVTYKNIHGTIIEEREERECLKDQLFRAYINVDEFKLNNTLYRIKGMRVSPLPEQTITVVLAYLRFYEDGVCG